MDHLQCNFKRLSKDILVYILARLDGSSLASAACTCSDLHGIARDQSLWKQLCHSTWPSTALEEAQQLISSSPMDGFCRFYADSYPHISQDDHKDTDNFFPMQQPRISPSNFASFIDVYYREKCITSSVLDGIPRAADFGDDDETTNDLMSWLFGCPFKVVLFDAYANQDDNEYEDGNGLRSANEEYGFVSIEQTKKTEDHSEELKVGIRLSWVLFDKKRGKAWNLSSWKPLLVKKIWAANGDYVLHFGCIFPVQESVLPHKLAKCLILARCNIEENKGYLRWKEIISMHIEDTNGAHVNGGKSLIILNQVLYCTRRSNNRHSFEKGYLQFEGKKQEMIKKKKLEGNIADWLCMCIEVAILISLGYYFQNSTTMA